MLYYSPLVRFDGAFLFKTFWLRAILISCALFNSEFTISTVPYVAVKMERLRNLCVLRNSNSLCNHCSRMYCGAAKS